jgi:hypothetical protein
MNHGIAGSFPCQLGEVFMRVKRKANLHEAEDEAEQDGKG